MPPRYAYWTILAGGLPTSFRATEREELLPTYNRLKEKQPDTEMKWFAKGQLWSSPEEARAASPSRPWSRRPDGDGPRPPRREESGDRPADAERSARPAAAPGEKPKDRWRNRAGGGEGAGGERRGKAWRPGGTHEDPRQKFIDAKKARNQFVRQERFDHKTGTGRRDYNRPEGGRPAPPRRDDQPRERPPEMRPREDAPRSAQPRNSGPLEERPWRDRPREDRPADTRPRASFDRDRPRENREGGRPPRQSSWTDRPREDKGNRGGQRDERPRSFTPREGGDYRPPLREDREQGGWQRDDRGPSRPRPAGKFGGGGDRRPSGDRRDAPRDTRSERPSFDTDRKPFRPKTDRPFSGERRDSQPRFESRAPGGGFGKPHGAWSDRKPAGGFDKPRSASFSGRPFGGDRPAGGARKPAFGARKPWSSGPPREGGAARRPFKPRSDDRPPRKRGNGSE